MKIDNMKININDGIYYSVFLYLYDLIYKNSVIERFKKRNIYYVGVCISELKEFPSRSVSFGMF